MTNVETTNILTVFAIFYYLSSQRNIITHLSLFFPVTFSSFCANFCFKLLFCAFIDVTSHHILRGYLIYLSYIWTILVRWVGFAYQAENTFMIWYINFNISWEGVLVFRRQCWLVAVFIICQNQMSLTVGLIRLFIPSYQVFNPILHKSFVT